MVKVRIFNWCSVLTDTGSKCDVCMACFDEALNKVAQRRQNGESNYVIVTRHLNSAFLGHAMATGLEQKFQDWVFQNILQVSEDRPRRNLKFLDSLYNR